MKNIDKEIFKKAKEVAENYSKSKLDRFNFDDLERQDFVQDACIRYFQYVKNHETFQIAFMITVCKHLRQNMLTKKKAPINFRINVDLDNAYYKKSNIDIHKELENKDLYKKIINIPHEGMEILLLQSKGYGYSDIFKMTGVPRSTAQKKKTRCIEYIRKKILK